MFNSTVDPLLEADKKLILSAYPSITDASSGHSYQTINRLNREKLEYAKDLRKGKRIDLFQNLAWLVPMGLGMVSMPVGVVIEGFVRGVDWSTPPTFFPTTVTVGLCLWGVSIAVLFGLMVFVKGDNGYGY